MYKSKLLLCFTSCAFILFSCKKEQDAPAPVPASVQSLVMPSPAVTPIFTEGFESTTKTTYPRGPVSFSSGVWVFIDALTGVTTNDHKAGLQAARIRNSGKIAMNFNLAQGISVLSIDHAVFGTDGASTWELRVSTDNGVTWIKNGNTISTVSASLKTETFYINKQGNLRIAVVKTGGGANKIDIDNISIYPYTLTSQPDNDHMLMGNPSNAIANISSPENYLMVKTYYDLSYSRSKGTPNWVSWHLQASDVGSTSRQDDYRPDNTLPASWYQVNESSYSGSGFDRGHNCPSGDRTSSVAANSSTFLMTNMIPQAPHNNQLTWASLEDTCRLLAQAGNELYIIMGSYGIGGTGSSGSYTLLDNGRVTVPSNVWKVVVVLSLGNGDINRITGTTRIIAINTPNINTTSSNWKSYRTSVDAIEAATGYDIFSNLPAPEQNVLEAKVDNL